MTWREVGLWGGLIVVLYACWLISEFRKAPLLPPEHPEFEERPWWLVGDPEDPDGWTQGDVFQTLLDIDHVDEVQAL